MVNSSNNNDSVNSSSTWTLGRFLSCGAYGLVYSATYVNPNNGFSKEIAIKRATIESSSSLEKERRILAAFSDCPDIIDCYSGETTTDDKGRSFYNLLLEYAPAGTLEDLIKQSNGQGLPENQVKAYTRMILTPLVSMHARGYVHCDLKPENILAFPTSSRSSYQLKLADFGQSKEPGEQIPAEKLKGSFRGTPDFMSPESVELGEIGPELDVWSLGCTVAMMVTGKYPWSFFTGGLDLEVLLNLIARGDMEIPKNIGEEGKDFLKRCFERDPRNRWSAQMLLNHPYIDSSAHEISLPSSEIFRSHSNNDRFGRVVKFLLPQEMFNWTLVSKETMN